MQPQDVEIDAHALYYLEEKFVILEQNLNQKID